MGRSGGRGSGFWRVWLADIEAAAKELVKQRVCTRLHEWCRCFDCMMLKLAFAYSSILFAKNRLNYVSAEAFTIDQPS